MEISYLFLVTTILFGLSSLANPSNPDSEPIQDSSDFTNTENVQKSAAIQSAESSQARSPDDRYSRLPVIRLFRPVVTSTRIYWGGLRIGNGTVLYDVRRAGSPPDLDSNNNSRGQTSTSSNRRQRPPNNDWGNNRNNPGASEGGNNRYFQQNDDRRINGNRPATPEWGNDRYIPPNNGGVPFSGGSAGDQGVRINSVPSGAQSPSGFQPGIGGQNRGGTSGNTPFIRGFGRNVTSSSGQGYGARIPPETTRGGWGLQAGTTTPNRRVSPDSNFFAGIVNDFAFKLVEKLNLESSNFVLSPLSVFIALSMLYLGSEGQTSEQLQQALGLNQNSVHGETLHRGIRDLVSLVSGRNAYQLFVANGMFLGRNFTPEAEFAEEMQRYYAAELNNLDFKKPDLTMSIINDWVSRSTRNMIPILIDRPPPEQTRLLLMNAVYFKGVWKTQFPANLTYSGRFFAADGSTKEVPTMSLHEETFPLYNSDDHRHTFIKLPYAGDQVSMIIALPYSQNEPPMPSVRDQTLCYVRDALRETRLDSLIIPKFTLEDVHSLRIPLQQLGVSDIFSLRNVNLRRLRRQNDLYVSAILHKAVVEVNEQGTTAAAVTGVRFVDLWIRNTTDFVADHPFAFYIIHEPSGLVLFYGKVNDIGEIVAGGGSNRRGYEPPVRPRPNSDAHSNTPGNAPGNTPANARINVPGNARINVPGNARISVPNNSRAQRNPSSRVRIHGAVTYENPE